VYGIDISGIHAEATAGNRVIDPQEEQYLWENLSEDIKDKHVIHGTREAYLEWITAHIQRFSGTEGIALLRTASSRNKFLPAYLLQDKTKTEVTALVSQYNLHEMHAANYFIPRAKSGKFHFKAEDPRAMISTGGKSAQVALPLITAEDIVHWRTFILEASTGDRSEWFCGTEQDYSNFFSVMRVNEGIPLAIGQIDEFCKPWHSPEAVTHHGSDYIFHGCILTVSFLTGGDCADHNLGGSDGTKSAVMKHYAANGDHQQQQRWTADAPGAVVPTSCMTTCRRGDCKADLVAFVKQDKRFNFFQTRLNQYLSPNFRGATTSTYKDAKNAVQWVPAGAVDTLWGATPDVDCLKEVGEFVSRRWMHLFLDVYIDLFAYQHFSISPRYAKAGADKSRIKKNSWVVGKAATVGTGYLRLCQLQPGCTLEMDKAPPPHADLEELDSALIKLISD
jgi:hypothetical protein